MAFDNTSSGVAEASVYALWVQGLPTYVAGCFDVGACLVGGWWCIMRCPGNVQSCGYCCGKIIIVHGVFCVRRCCEKGACARSSPGVVLCPLCQAEPLHVLLMYVFLHNVHVLFLSDMVVECCVEGLVLEGVLVGVASQALLGCFEVFGQAGTWFQKVLGVA